MKKINRNELLENFVVPPQNMGQIVEVSYSCTSEHIIERINDRTDNSVKYMAYDFVDDEFDPWNGAPRLGRRIGEVQIV